MTTKAIATGSKIAWDVSNTDLGKTLTDVGVGLGIGAIAFFVIRSAINKAQANNIKSQVGISGSASSIAQQYIDAGVGGWLWDDETQILAITDMVPSLKFMEDVADAYSVLTQSIIAPNGRILMSDIMSALSASQKIQFQQILANKPRRS